MRCPLLQQISSSACGWLQAVPQRGCLCCYGRRKGQAHYTELGVGLDMRWPCLKSSIQSHRRLGDGCFFSPVSSPPPPSSFRCNRRWLQGLLTCPAASSLWLHTPVPLAQLGSRELWHPQLPCGRDGRFGGMRGSSMLAAAWDSFRAAVPRGTGSS